MTVTTRDPATLGLLRAITRETEAFAVLAADHTVRLRRLADALEAKIGPADAARLMALTQQPVRTMTASDLEALGRVAALASTPAAACPCPRGWRARAWHRGHRSIDAALIAATPLPQPLRHAPHARQP
jgi:hypothetical protein